jgi:phosphoenolpyruvate phosphomutase
MVRVHGRGRAWLLAALDQVRGRPEFPALGMPDLLNELIAAGRPVKVLYIHGHWLDVNKMEDLSRASDFAYGTRPCAGSGGAT